MRLAFILMSVGVLVGTTGSSAYAQLAEIKAFDTTQNDHAADDRIYMDALKEEMLGNEREAEALLQRFISERPNVAAAYYELAKMNAKNGNTEQAAQYIQKAIALDGDNKWYKELYANLLANSIRYAEAAKIFAELADKYTPNDDYRLKASLLYQRANEPGKAVVQLEELLKKREGDEDILIQISQIYQKQQETDKAAETIRRLIKVNPEEGRYYGILADIYMKDSRNDEAKKVFDEAEKRFPNDIAIQLGLASYYRRKSDTAMYLRYVNKSIENTSIDPETQLTLLISYLQEMGKDTALRGNAVQVTERMVARNPDNATLQNILGDLYNLEGESQKAAAAYKRSLDIDAANLDVWQQFLFNFTAKEQADSLLYYSDKAIELYPSSAILYYLKGIANANKGNFEAAVSSYSSAIDYQPEDNVLLLSEMYAAQGDAYNSLKNYPQADKSFDKALKLNADNATVLNNYAYYLSLRKERLEDALKFSERSLKLRPGEATFLDTYGWILYERGEYEKAKTYIQEAVDKVGAEADATLYEHLGDIYYRLKDKSKALQYWQQALLKDPENEKIRKKIKNEKINE